MFLLLLTSIWLAYGAPLHYLEPIDPQEFEDTSYSTQLTKSHQRDDGNPAPGTREDFGTGKLTSAIGTGDDAIRSVVMETNGKLTAAGRTSNGTYDGYLIVRYHPDGGLDTSFSSSGKLAVTFGTRSNIVHSLVLQTDGSYTVVGKVDVGVHDGYSKVGILRTTSNGSLDTSFNTSGKFISSLGSNITDIGRKILLGANGSLSVLGYGWDATRWRSEALRVTSDGLLDTSFNTSGKTLHTLSATDDGHLGGALHTDGTLIAVGASHNADFDFALAKYLTDGRLDTAFHTDGKTSIAILSSDDRAFSIVLATAGLLYVGGIASNGANNDFALARLLSDGSLDTSFKTTGRGVFALGSGDDQLNDLGLETTGKIFAFGYSHNGTNNDFALLRVNTDGNLDTSFDTDGQSLLAIGSNEDSGQSLSLLSHGHIVAAGRSISAGSFDVAVVRYQTDGTLARSGALDMSFGTGGIQVLSLSVGTDAIHTLNLQTDGKFVAQGVTSSDLAVVRFNRDGNLDTSFATTGTYTNVITQSSQFRFGGLGIQTDGKIMAGKSDASCNLNVVRLLTEGALDTSFATSGKSVTTNPDGACDVAFVQNVFLDTEERIVAANLGTLRVTTSGALDTTYATDGLNSATNYFRYLTPLENSTIMQFGFQDSIAANVRKYKTDGNLDTTFDTDGLKSMPTGGLSAFGITALSRSRGGIIAAGSSGGTAPFVRVTIARMSSSGLIDTTFSTSGTLTDTFFTTNYSLPRPSIIEVENGKVVYARQHLGNFALKRWNTNGSIDTSFNTTGYVTTDISGNDFVSSVVVTTTGKICLGGMTNGYADFAIACYWP